MRILLVEDELDIQSIVEKSLQDTGDDVHTNPNRLHELNRGIFPLSQTLVWS